MATPPPRQQTLPQNLHTAIKATKCNPGSVIQSCVLDIAFHTGYLLNQ